MKEKDEMMEEFEEENALEVLCNYAEQHGALRERVRMLQKLAEQTNDVEVIRNAIRKACADFNN